MEQAITIRRRIAKLRFEMQVQGINACIISSSDPHQSEYTAPRWQIRTWFSGFTGSAGTLVVTLTAACLWTDSRYFLQAEKELENTGIFLQKAGLPDTLPLEDWLCKHLQQGDLVGIDGSVFSVREADELRKKLLSAGISLQTTFDPLGRIWPDRPAIPEHPVFLLPEEFSGEPTAHKIARIKEKVTRDGCDAILLCALDEIAWTFNLRGTDVPCNPVAIAYALITPQESVVFIHPGKVNPEVVSEWRLENIRISEYDRLPVYLANRQEPLKIRLDPGKTHQSLFEVLRKLAERGNQISYSLLSDPSPVAMLKAVKNETEINGFRKAVIRDGVVMIRLWMWIEQGLSGQKRISEIDIENKLKELRSRQPLYFGESFPAIVGYGEHGAIVHYHATEESNAFLKPEGILLIDTGAQYFDGTTDMTRTVALGEVADAVKHDFTLVLKGHIALAAACFPKGTRGAQLDVLARRLLWKEGLTYFHGTGHGVGHFLNVHEGPQNIRLEENPVALEPGMVTSNEPGVYRAGAYGIRIENLMLVQKDRQTDFGDFYSFETLTLCPIDIRLIEREILSNDEREWLNQYHRTVYDRLSPQLDENERMWLKERTNE